MSENKLKPCPFCGGKVYLDREDIFCDNCDLHMNIYSRYTDGEAKNYEEAREQTIEAWNTRKPVEKILEQLEELKENSFDEEYQIMCKAIEIIKEVS